MILILAAQLKFYIVGILRRQTAKILATKFYIAIARAVKFAY
jgi:hypothetical protein